MILWPTAGQSARVSLDPDACIEFYFDLRTYEVKQCVFQENLMSW